MEGGIRVTPTSKGGIRVTPVDLSGVVIEGEGETSDVTSVNGKIGDVVIDANDVNAYSKSEVDALIPVQRVQYHQRWVYETSFDVNTGFNVNLMSKLTPANLIEDHTPDQLGAELIVFGRISFPRYNTWGRHTIALRLWGSLAGNSGTSREFRVLLSPGSAIATTHSANVVKTQSNNLTGRSVNLIASSTSLANSNLLIENVSGVTLTITKFEFEIYGE